MIALSLKRFGSLLLHILLGLALSRGVSADQTLSWSQWVEQLRLEAIADGIAPKTFDRIFAKIPKPSKQVLHYDRTQPETRLTFEKYRTTRASAYRIKLGRQALKRYRPLLSEISEKYGVSTCFIVSLWGLESSYGRFMGSFPVIKSLATLAYDSRRSAFFRKQLMYALHIVNDGHVDLSDFKGEWAGGSGQPQFLPSSWYHYAVDYNQDGRKDIWDTKSDVFASIANYLVQHGWQSDEPWAVPVRVPQGFDESLVNSKEQETVGQWRNKGLTTLDDRAWPDNHFTAELIQPYGGPNFLIFNNFKVIMKWNHSSYYAGTVGYMAEKICKEPL